jgi:hypothetical protein
MSASILELTANRVGKIRKKVRRSKTYSVRFRINWGHFWTVSLKLSPVDRLVATRPPPRGAKFGEFFCQWRVLSNLWTTTYSLYTNVATCAFIFYNKVVVDWNVAIKFDILLITCFRNNSNLFWKKSYFALMQFGVHNCIWFMRNLMWFWTTLLLFSLDGTC